MFKYKQLHNKRIKLIPEAFENRYDISLRISLHFTYS